MRLNSRLNPALPKLAWVADVDRGGGTVTLEHGPFVEARAAFFIAGVWNGPFGPGDFGDTDCVFGSGGVLGDEGIRFVSSASTTECLYYSESGPRVVVSNSLPLLLAATGDALDPLRRDYPALNDSMLDGIHAYVRDVPTRDGKIRRLMYRNLDVSDSMVSESDKREAPPFRDFTEYTGYLRTNYGLIAGNARDQERGQLLEIFSTQSRGYDTTAVNAIARDFGVDKVFTVTRAKSMTSMAYRENDDTPDDDGRTICEALGLECVPIDRKSFLQDFDDEYLYYCTRHHNQDANLRDIAKHVSGAALLLTGVLGEIWYSQKSLDSLGVDISFTINSELKTDESAGHGMTEFGLVAGLIQVPLPYIGALRSPEILERITESAEMAPWRLGNRYDRPIARRIAEEAGVPRGEFGQVNRGSVVIFPPPAIPFGKALREEFLDYLIREGAMRRPAAWCWRAVRRINSVLMLKNERRYYAIHYLERAVSKLIGRRFRFGFLWSRYNGSLFCFSVNRTAQSYSRLLGGSAGSPVEGEGVPAENVRVRSPLQRAASGPR